MGSFSFQFFFWEKSLYSPTLKKVFLPILLKSSHHTYFDQPFNSSTSHPTAILFVQSFYVIILLGYIINSMSKPSMFGKKHLILLLITFQVAHTIDLRHEDSARLTQYIGAGYDILQGNPEAEDRFDPGFKHPVFQLSYNQGKKTNDRKYEVPDRTYARDSRSCNF